MRRLAEIIVRLQQHIRTPRKQSKPGAQIGYVFAARIDRQVGPPGGIVECVHICRQSPEPVAGLPVEGPGDRRDFGIDVDAIDRRDVEAGVVEKHCRQYAVPSTQNPYATELAAAAFEQPVECPHLAGDLLVVEGVGDIGFRMLGDDARQPCHERAFDIGSNSPREVQGLLVPVHVGIAWLRDIHHIRLVCWDFGRRNLASRKAV